MNEMGRQEVTAPAVRFETANPTLVMTRTWSDGIRLAFAAILYTAVVTVAGVIVALFAASAPWRARAWAAIGYGVGSVILFVLAFWVWPQVTSKLMGGLVRRAETRKGEIVA